MTRVTATAVLAIALAGGVLAGCGEQDENGLPAFSASPTSSGPRASEDEVAARMAAYHTVVRRISAGAPLDLERLGSVATPSWAKTVGQNLQQTKAQGFTLHGVPKESDRTVTVEGGSATVRSCIDSRGLRLKKDGRPHSNAGQKATPPEISEATLVQQAGTWKVSGIRKAGPC